MDSLLDKNTKKVNLMLVGEKDSTDETDVFVVEGEPKMALRIILGRCGYKYRKNAGVKGLLSAFNKNNGAWANYYTIIQLPLDTQFKKIAG